MLPLHRTRAQITHRYILANILVHSFVPESEIPVNVKCGAEEPQKTKGVWKRDSERQSHADVHVSGGLPSRESQSCWDDGSEGRARALYSKTTELEMIWLLMATCSVTRPVS